jgi:hypothetical protein
MPSCAGVGPPFRLIQYVLSAENPPTWEMLHPSEMKGPVLPFSAVRGFQGSLQCSGMRGTIFTPSREPQGDEPSLFPDGNRSQSSSMHHLRCGTKPKHDESARHVLPTWLRHPCAHQTHRSAPSPTNGRPEYPRFRYACSCHFTARPRPPTGCSWQCFGNPPRGRPRHRVFEIA